MNLAKQHFYSRVPACMSMYQHADGYDTFAQSEGLSQEYTEATVQKLIHIKLSPEEKRRVEEGVYPPVYCVYNGPGGDRLQSKICFLPKDFSGEQSCFFVHTLILQADEARKAMCLPDTALVSPAAFSVSPDRFDWTDPKSRYDEAFPETEYKADSVSAEAISDWYQKYPYNTVRQFLSTLLRCGFSGSYDTPIYVLLPVEDRQLSAAAVEFMNIVLSPFPDFIKNLATFASYTEDFIRFKSCRVRFLPRHLEGAAAGVKGTVFDFFRSIGNIIKEEVYRTNAAAVEFLYGLYEDHELRSRFIRFYQNAVEKDRQYAKFDKSFFEFIDLFKKCSGAFQEEEAFPDDAAVYQLLVAYEKYHDLLEPEDRKAILTVLQRYQRAKTAIPKDIFSKINRLYPKEPSFCKEVIMDVILSLLHTDVMRNKLFLFIKANIHAETPERKTLILQHLAQVLRGGFLQSQIMELIAECYEEEPSGSRLVLMEKVLLTLRTDAVQDAILAFLRKSVSDAEDDVFELVISTLADMLWHNDDLCRKCLSLLDEILSATDAKRQQFIFNTVFPVIESNKRPELIQTIAGMRGELSREALRRALIYWGGRKISGLFFDLLFAQSLADITVSFADIHKFCLQEAEISDKSLSSLCEAFVKETGKQLLRADLFAILEFGTSVKQAVDGLPQARWQRFIKSWEKEEFWPAVLDKLYQALDPAHPDGLTVILAELSRVPAYQDNPSVLTLRRADDFLKAVHEKAYAKALAILLQLPLEESFRSRFSEKLLSEFSSESPLWYTDAGALPSAFFFEAFLHYMKTGTFPLDEISRSIWKKCLSERFGEEELSKAASKPTEDSAKLALDLWEAAARFCDLLASTDCSQGLRVEVYSGVECYLQKACVDLKSRMRSKEKKQLSLRITELTALNSTVLATLDLANKEGKSGFGFFRRLFK